MKTIDVGMHVRAPIEQVWDFWSNHEGYSRLKMVSHSELLQEGSSERNGVGAVRKVRILGITFVEDIVTFDPPNLLEYKVKKSTIPILHPIGTMEFTSSGGGTYMHWVTSFEGRIPIIQSRLDPVLCFVFGKIFKNFLAQSKKIMES